jgi:DGQHR domain-containing protein
MSGTTLVNISYVARRGESEEQGAVQRILNKRRITGIKDFLLNGGFFPNNIILNFVKLENIQIDEEESTLSIEEEPRIAQIIDGQHRVEGLREAIKIDGLLGNMELPVLLTMNIETAKCAEIFVSINTEQKSVPKSLIYDLYGLLNVQNRDFSVDRGTDIAEILNKDEHSPYQGFIKFPGTRKFKGGIQLSTLVNNLKLLVKPEGEFSKYSLDTLEVQAKVLINYFKAIENCYDKDWDHLTNPFLYASGFGAAIDVFISKVLPYCFAQKKFSESFFKSIIQMPKTDLILQSAVKGLSGEAARERIKLKLAEVIVIEVTKEEDFEI